MNVLSAIYSDKNSNLVSHYHNYHQIMYIVSGEVQITVNEKAFIAKENSIVILSRFEKHSVKVVRGEYKRYVIEVSPKLFVPVLINRPESFCNVISVDGCREIKDLFEIVINEYRDQKPFYEKILDLTLEKLFVYIERLQNFEENTGKSIEIVYNIQKELEKNYKDNYSLENLTEKYHLSRYHLSRLFKKITGYAPVEYLIECRMSAAKRYLCTTNLSVQEIVEKCGFGDASNFCRKFKEKNGVTPLMYRKKYKQK